MSDKVFYITTPIYYLTDVPHVGNASTTIAADVVARLKRLQGHKVLSATGTDENAIKVAEAADAQGLPTQEFVDNIVPRWTEAWGRMHIAYDDFIRTTEPRHRAVVEAAFQKLVAQGDIYKDVYKGWYCVSDETFFREAEVADGFCPNPECRKPVRWVEEENYFFRLSAYADRLLQYIDEHPDFLGPESRKNEVVSFIKAGLRDACMTRKAYGWGILVPGDLKQVIYVWFDALLNYLTVAGYLSDEKKFSETWPADVQLVGKDIFVRFHSTLWPAMLMALGVDQPRRIFAHGFWTVEGEKMSKSKGNAVSPVTVAEDLAAMSGADVDVAVDAVRYYLMREVTFGLDGDFSVGGLIGRFNSDLANDLGNLLNRTLPLLHKHRGGIVPQPDDRETQAFSDLVTATANEVANHIDRLQFSEALQAIWAVIGRANKYMEEQAPWKLAKDETCRAKLDTVLYTVLETVRAIAILIQPFMPSAAEAIWEQLGIEEPLASQKWVDAETWGRLKPGTHTRSPKPIFPRVDTRRAAAEPAPIEEEQVEQISFDEFKRLDLRVGKIVAADRVPGASKLLQLTVDIGAELRPMVAGIAQWYSPEELVGKQVVVIANLAPATIRGVESRGMLLAADVDGTAVLLEPDKEVPPGSTVR
ncbi:MAG TPA: methionine--tRNA ligase [Armatimonadota bacterium]|nr:methionine--tRNA ligase [Armatimonadota bacterium]